MISAEGARGGEDMCYDEATMYSTTLGLLWDKLPEVPMKLWLNMFHRLNKACTQTQIYDSSTAKPWP